MGSHAESLSLVRTIERFVGSNRKQTVVGNDMPQPFYFAGAYERHFVKGTFAPDGIMLTAQIGQ
jgi:hypothetical protein